LQRRISMQNFTMFNVGEAAHCGELAVRQNCDFDRRYFESRFTRSRNQYSKGTSPIPFVYTRRPEME
jgi:hypothetical protein